MRKFYLVNKNNEKYYFDDLTHFVLDPTGLGTSKNTEYNDFYNIRIKVSEKVNYDDITLDLVCADYVIFNSFTRFIAVGNLTLYYELPGLDTFYMKVSIASIEKGEIKEDSKLHTPITFQSLSNWRTGATTLLSMTKVTSGKSYKPTYTYPYKYSDNNLNYISVNNTTDTFTPIVLTIIGASNNPAYSLIDSEGNMVSQGQIFISTYENESIRIDSNIDNLSMIKVDVNGNIINVYDKQNIDLANFIYIPPGQHIFYFNNISAGSSATIEYEAQYDIV